MADKKKNDKPKPIDESCVKEGLRQISLTTLNNHCTIISSYAGDSVEMLSARGLALLRHLKQLDEGYEGSDDIQ